MPQIAAGTETDLGDGTMLVKRTSAFTRKDHEMTLRITPAQLAAWRGGELIDRAMPDLTPGEREFLMTGTTQEEWDAAFPPEDED